MALQEIGKKSKRYDFQSLGLNPSIIYWNLDSKTLTDKTLELSQGVLNDRGALCVNIGKFTGRSP